MIDNNMTEMRNQSAAGERYRREHNKAQMADLLSKISGENTDLVRFDEVAKRLRARQRIEMGTRDGAAGQDRGQCGTLQGFYARHSCPVQAPTRYAGPTSMPL